MTAARMIQREFTRNFVATLLVLIAVSLSVMSIKALSLATSGELDAKDVLIYTLLLGIRQLPVVLCISLMISIISCLSRLGNDSELVILSTSGWSPFDTLLAIVKFSLPIVASIFFLAIFVWPIGSQSLQSTKESFKAVPEYNKAKPGTFITSKSQNKTWFAKTDANGHLSDIFLYKILENGHITTKSNTGDLIKKEGEDWIVTKSGSSTKINTTSEDISVTTFQSSEVNLAEKSNASASDSAPNTKSTYELITIPTPANLSELSWRIGLVISAFNLSIVAILFSSTNKRLGKSGNFILGLLIFILYMNLIILGQRYIQTGKFGFFQYNLTLHLSFFFLIAISIYRKFQLLR
jgi:lipopolysaccharide export system permease protein